MVRAARRVRAQLDETREGVQRVMGGGKGARRCWACREADAHAAGLACGPRLCALLARLPKPAHAARARWGAGRHQACAPRLERARGAAGALRRALWRAVRRAAA
jgi:hypothetical protein